jgi:dihydrofolate reductase
MKVNAILAHDLYYGIGKNNSLPWPHNKEDMKWFKNWTEGHVVVMGRKTWESLGCKPLKNRINVVVSNGEVQGNPHYVRSGNIEDIIYEMQDIYLDLKIWFIGGAEIYRQAIQFCDRIYVTKINGMYACDTFVNIGEILRSFEETEKEIKEELTFSVWSKRK